MYSWSDMSKVKKELWNKLHGLKDIMKKKATNLAQMISANAQSLANNYVPQPVRESFGQLYSYTQPEAIVQKEQPIALGQVASYSENEPEAPAVNFQEAGEPVHTQKMTQKADVKKAGKARSLKMMPPSQNGVKV
jgi:hypothetical protein